MKWKCPSCGYWSDEGMGRMCAACKTEIATPRPEWWTTDDWATPQELFDKYDAEYGPFDLDAAARPGSAKCSVFYTKEENGLELPWFGKVWINPPYSEPGLWCRRAAEETQKDPDLLVVMLLPAAVDTHWFHDWVIPFADWQPLRGRPKFIGWMGTPIGSPKAGNVLAVYPKRAR